ncbi:MAG: methyltransferase domain-containing protein [Anaerolineales bacterium]|nr:methyltransferase domain-containing protein [Anaerolineales bacterium]
MGQDLNKIENLYDNVAEEYGRNFFGEHEKKPQDREILLRLAQEIGDNTPVWDFGCGPGQTTKFLHDLGVEIAGLDLSEKILEQARLFYPEIHFQKGNMLDLEFEDDSIAGIVAFYAIVHFTTEQVETALMEIYRVLQPGGIFLFTFHIGEETIHVEEFLDKKIDIEFMFFTTEFINRCLREIGFEEIEILERDPYPGVEYQSQRAYVFAFKPVELKTL